MLVQVETGVSSGVFTVRGVQFNSTSEPNMSFPFASDILVAAGVRVQVIMSNVDKSSMDLYSTVQGFEV